MIKNRAHENAVILSIGEFQRHIFHDKRILILDMNFCTQIFRSLSALRRIPVDMLENSLLLSNFIFWLRFPLLRSDLIVDNFFLLVDFKFWFFQKLLAIMRLVRCPLGGMVVV